MYVDFISCDYHNSFYLGSLIYLNVRPFFVVTPFLHELVTDVVLSPVSTDASLTEV